MSEEVQADHAAKQTQSATEEVDEIEIADGFYRTTLSDIEAFLEAPCDTQEQLRHKILVKIANASLFYQRSIAIDTRAIRELLEQKAEKAAFDE